MQKNIFYERGQSLFELVLAIGVIGIIMVAVVSLVNNSLQNATFARNQSQATRLAEEATEWLRVERDDDIDAFIAKASTAPVYWCLKDNPLTSSSWNQHSSCSATNYISNTKFLRQVQFTYTSTPKILIVADVTVRWNDSKGDHIVKSSTKFVDWRQR